LAELVEIAQNVAGEQDEFLLTSFQVRETVRSKTRSETAPAQASISSRSFLGDPFGLPEPLANRYRCDYAVVVPELPVFWAAVRQENADGKP
jgi:hypothetical protein